MIEVNDTLVEPYLAGVIGDGLAGKWDYGWRSNQAVGFAHWNVPIVNCPKKNISPVELPQPMASLWALLRKGLPEGAYPIRCYANSHTHGTEGSPHTDSEHDNETTAVLYLNKEWKREWGGETAFYEDQEVVKSVMPKFGRLVMFSSNVVHCARAVSRICPVARVTAMIKARHPQGDPDLMKLEKFLFEIGADKKKHKHGSLKDHLVRVYEILKAKGAPRETCLAGGTHSVYGTSSYKDICLTDRGVIRDEFGPVVEELVHAFSTDGPATCDELNLIRAANLKDQDALKSKPGYKEIWDNYKCPLQS